MLLTTSQKKHITILFFLAPFLIGAGIDLYVPSLPAIATYFATTKYLVQFTVGFYLLGYALGQGLFGILSDSFGRKKIFMAGIISYTIISLLAAFAPNIYYLIVYRFLQAFAIAGAGVVCRAIAKDCFSGAELSKAMSYISMSWAVGPILGPVIGGYLEHYFNWHASFYFFGLYGFVICVFAWLTLFETRLETSPLQPRKVSSNIKEILNHPVFLQLVIMSSLVYGILVIYSIIAPFLIQVHLNYTAIDYGHFSLLLGLGYFLGSFTNRYLVHYFSSVKIMLFSIISGLAISLIMMVIGTVIQTNIYIILTPTFLLFFSVGLILPNIMANTVTLFPNVAGTASALYGTFTAGGAFIMSLFATLLETNTQTSLAIMYVALFLFSFLLFLPEVLKRIKKSS